MARASPSLLCRIPNEAYAADFVAVGKVLKVCVEFSLVEPQGGLHFVVPENPFKHQENNNQGHFLTRP